MTIAGVCVTGPLHAMVWADTAQTTAKPYRVTHVPKIAVNVARGMVGIGIGLVKIIECAEVAMKAAESYEGARVAIRLALMRATLRELEPRPQASVEGNAFILAGFDRGHVAATAFEMATGFAPAYVRHWCVPYLDEVAGLDPEAPADLLPIAIAQCVAGGWTDIVGNKLTVAKITPNGIMCAPVADLTKGNLLWNPLRWL